MSTNVTVLATRYAGRPLLLLPRAAEELAHRVHAIDDRAIAKPGRLSALLRKLSGGAAVQPMAMDDDHDYTPPPIEQRLAYAPLYAGDVEAVGYCWSLKDGVALLQVDTPLLERGEDFCGTVYHGYDTLLYALREAVADARVRAIFIRMSSPGGVVAGGLAALSKFMREARASAGGKPIWVYADMACSAAYWIASQADRILAPSVGLVGSIGVVIVHESYAAWLKEAGVEITPIQFGAKKTSGAWWEGLSPEAKADLQSEIDQCGRNFVAEVEAGRPAVTAEAAIATQAAVYMAEHDEPERSGLALKLVDAIASEEEAFDELRALVAQPVSTPASGQSSASAAGGRRASTPKEEPMAGKALTPGRQAALSRAKAALARAQADVKRLEAEAATEEDPKPTDEPGDQPSAEGEGDTAPEDDVEELDEEDTEGEGDKVDAKVAQAVLALPEAKGREALAQKLAFTPGMTVEQAKAFLEVAPRGGGLSAEMSGSRRLGPDGAAPKAVGARLDPREIYSRRAQRGKAAAK